MDAIDVLTEFPDAELDPYWVRENLDRATRSFERIPAVFADATVTVPEVAAWVRTIVTAAVEDARAFNPRVQHGPPLLLLGPVGTGKTHQAYGAIRAIATSGVGCGWLFTTAADLYGHLRPRDRGNPEEELERYANVPLLVLDDVGASKSSEWTEEVNYRLINRRYEHRRPTILTSNLGGTQLRDFLGERVASRLTEATRVALKGEDRRRLRKVAS